MTTVTRQRPQRSTRPRSPRAILSAFRGLVAYCDGRFVPASRASVSVWDHGFLYGDGVFEGIRAYERGVFKLTEHLDRLFRGCRLVSIVPPIDEAGLTEIILEVLRRSGLADAHIRPIITRGVGLPGLDPRRSGRSGLTVVAYPLQGDGSRGLRLTVSAVRRKAPHSVDPQIKSLNYLDSVLAKLQANAGGYDDALMLASDGTVSETTGANVFAVRDGVLATPPTTSALPGITRQTVLDMAPGFGWTTEIRPMTVGDLAAADEVFLCGTAIEIAGVTEIDGRPVGAGVVGAITSELVAAYQGLVRTSNRTTYDGLHH